MGFQCGNAVSKFLNVVWTELQIKTVEVGKLFFCTPVFK